MKSTNDFQTSNPEMVTVSRAEYEEKNARLAAQDERIAELEQQVSVLMEALRLARHSNGPHNVWHWQQNTWSNYNGVSRITGSAKHWTIWGRRI